MAGETLIFCCIFISYFGKKLSLDFGENLFSGSLRETNKMRAYQNKEESP